MKVVVLGGYGVFGERVVHLLCRDGHDVVIAGRNLNSAQALAGQVGATALQLDRTGDLGPLFDLAPDVVVDAAGPFHAYGDDPYGFARAVLERGMHYLDLCDDADFCKGISALDDLARDKGCFALSGLSSVPAVSSAAVAALADGLEEIDTIESAILPGNRAPRGKSVIASILSQAGQPMQIWRGGQWDQMRSWSDPVRYQLAPGLRRQGWVINVPDLQLFPEAFGARTVMFRAGLELGVMNYGLGAFSWARGKLGFPVGEPLFSLTRAAAQMLWPFGSDRGGMVVHVTGREGVRWIRRSWYLVAEQGEGPFIPAVATRAALRAPDRITPGARAAVASLDLAQIEDAISDLAVETLRKEQDIIPAFQQVLGDSFHDLPEPVQASHQTVGTLRMVGTSQISRGTHPLSRLTGWLFRFPKANDDIPVEVIKTRQGKTEVWERNFDGHRFRSYLTPGENGMIERFGPISFLLGLHVKDRALHFPVLSARAFNLIPIPKWLLPISVATESAENGQFRFDVKLSAPIGIGLVVHYRGQLRSVGQGLADQDVARSA
ncbi:SDR family oxidoreductase [Pseudaestuariivita rosea]|uniref:SDR family oxidoreductase n=1 Tax=Pseudaestuariivita rosea TaxID=2763263 RepID=UPI001ABBB13F|nr:SDR family oxidoreductase [Pseudaestuariivita rosea]